MCYLADCTGPEIWQPILNLRSRSDGEITVLKFKTIRACDEHKTAATVDNFLSSEGYNKLAHHMRDAGKPVPQRRLTTLAWVKDPAAPADIQPTMPSAEEDLPF
jgi:hypothetical protein